MKSKSFRRNLIDLGGSLLAAVIVVKGIIAIVPDAILLDRYGDVRGIFQLALAVIAITIFSVALRWIDGID